MSAAESDDLRAGTVTARVNLLFAALHARDEQPFSNADMATAVADETGVAFPAAQLEQVRDGDASGVTSRQLAALAQTFGVPGEYFNDEERAKDIDSQLDLLRTLRDANSGLGCIRGGVPATPAARDQVRDLVRWVETEEARRARGTASEGTGAAHREQPSVEPVTPPRPAEPGVRRGWWQRLTGWGGHR